MTKKIQKIQKILSPAEGNLVTLELISSLKFFNCKNLVKIYDVSFQEDRSQYVAEMEFCNLLSLNELTTKGKLDISVINLLICDVLNGLGYLHDRNFVHSDLKISNILANRHLNEIVFKIGDLFTIKENLGKFQKKGGYYTPEIIAPECYLNHKFSFKADIWAFGVMLYFLFTGNFPFGDRRGLSLKQVEQNILKLNFQGVNLNQIPSPTEYGLTLI